MKKLTILISINLIKSINLFSKALKLKIDIFWLLFIFI
jgi:hypothetical protein